MQVGEEGRKLELLNIELSDLRHKLSQNSELEKKIAELQKQLEDAKSSKQASLATKIFYTEQLSKCYMTFKLVCVFAG